MNSKAGVGDDTNVGDRIVLEREWKMDANLCAGIVVREIDVPFESHVKTRIPARAQAVDQ